MASSLEQKNLYEAKVRGELDKLNAQIDEFKAKAAQAEADTKIKYQDQLEALRVKQAAAQAKLQEFQTAAESAWEEMKSGLDAAWQELQSAFNRAMAELNE